MSLQCVGLHLLTSHFVGFSVRVILWQAVEEYVATSASKSDLDRTSVGKGKKKTGTDTGAMAVHPISGEKVKAGCLARLLFSQEEEPLRHGNGAHLSLFRFALCCCA